MFYLSFSFSKYQEARLSFSLDPQGVLEICLGFAHLFQVYCFSGCDILDSVEFCSLDILCCSLDILWSFLVILVFLAHFLEFRDNSGNIEFVFSSWIYFKTQWTLRFILGLDLESINVPAPNSNKLCKPPILLKQSGTHLWGSSQQPAQVDRDSFGTIRRLKTIRATHL